MNEELIKSAEQHAQCFTDAAKRSIDTAAFIDGARYMASAIYNHMTQQTEVGKDLCEQGVDVYYQLEAFLNFND